MRPRTAHALAVTLALAAALAPAATAAQGLLLPSELRVPALPSRLQDVQVELRDGAAITRVDQRFGNPSGRPLEATYLFPVPRGAAVEEFALWIGGQRTRGEVLEKDRAAQIYADIVRRMADPGLLEYLGNELFRARVFPVPPAGEQRIEIRYSQAIAAEAGLNHFRYPLGASSRSTDPALQKERFVFTATLRSARAIKSVYSPSHRISVQRKGDHEAVIGFEPSSPDERARDLDLYWSVADGDVGVSVITHRENAGEPGYFLALVSPKQEWLAQETQGKRVTFVIDTSGSMRGEKLTRAQQALDACLSRLAPGDQLNVIQFSTGVEALFAAPQPATPANVARAREFVRALEPLGGTAIDDALRRALADGAAQANGPHLVIFVTDGAPTVGETDEGAIVRGARAANVGASRIFTFGVGSDLNARLLDALAAEGRGVPEYAHDGADFERRLGAFWERLSHPVLTELALALGDAAAFDVFPRRLPDLFRGGQLVVLGRYRQAGRAEVSLEGAVDGGRRRFAETVDFPATRTDAAFVPRLWAVRKVGFLLDELRRGGERPELRDEVIALGKRFGIVTPYTSYLVLEDQKVAQAPEPMAGPHDAWAPASPATGSLGGSAGRGESRAAAAPAPALSTAEGDAGVRVSRRLKAMKEEERADEAGIRVVEGRTFVRRGGGWHDAALAANARVVAVRYLSEAYFALARTRPTLRAALALGERVRIGLPDGRAIEIAPDAGMTSAAELERRLR